MRTGGPPVPRRPGGRRGRGGSSTSCPSRSRAAASAAGEGRERGRRRAEQREVRLGQRQLGGCRAQVRRQHVRVARVQDGRLDRAVQQRIRVVHQVGVQRVVPGDQDGHRTAPSRPARPACCHSAALVPGQPAISTASSPPMFTPSSSAVVVARPVICAGQQSFLQGAALFGQVAGPVRGHPRGQVRRPGLGQVSLAPWATASAPRRDRTNASAGMPSATRSASSPAASAVAVRRTGAPASPRALVSGGSQSANVSDPRARRMR